VRRLHVGHPVADGLAGRVLQGRRPRRHRPHLRTPKIGVGQIAGSRRERVKRQRQIARLQARSRVVLKKCSTERHMLLCIWREVVDKEAVGQLYLSAKQPHPEHIQLLPLHVLRRPQALFIPCQVSV